MRSEQALGWHKCMSCALQNMPMLCPPEYMVCFLHRLISALRYYWDEYKASNPRASFSEGEWGQASSERLGSAVPVIV